MCLPRVGPEQNSLLGTLDLEGDDAMEAMPEMLEDELVREVETAKDLFPGAPVKVRRGRVIVFEENLIMLEPFALALQLEQAGPIE
jgi:hypothetical protein